MSKGRKRTAGTLGIGGVVATAWKWLGDYLVADQLWRDRNAIMSGFGWFLDQWWFGPGLVFVAVVIYIGMGFWDDWFKRKTNDESKDPPPSAPATQNQTQTQQGIVNAPVVHGPVVHVHNYPPQDQATPKDVLYTGGGWQAEHVKRLMENEAYERRKKEEAENDKQALNSLLTPKPNAVENRLTVTASEELPIELKWGGSMKFKAINRSPDMLPAVRCVLVDTRLWLAPHWVQTKDTHHDGRFKAQLETGKNDIYPQPAEWLGRLSNENFRIAIDGNGVGGGGIAHCRITIPGKWQLHFRLEDSRGRVALRTLCFEWAGEGHAPAALNCADVDPLPPPLRTESVGGN